MTEISVAETEVVLLREMFEVGDSWPPLSPEEREVDDDIADAPLPRC